MEDLQINTNLAVDDYIDLSRNMINFEANPFGMKLEELEQDDFPSLKVENAEYSPSIFEMAPPPCPVEPKFNLAPETETSSRLSSPRLSKRIKKPVRGQRKKRLRGEELIRSLRENPMFSKHEELFDANIDDAMRKKMMQKIRNRISAQESRDRRKNMIGEIRKNSELLRQENIRLKQQNAELLKENSYLKELLAQADPNNKHGSSEHGTKESSTGLSSNSVSEIGEGEDINELGELIRDHAGGSGNAHWRTFAIFMVGVMICSLTMPEEAHTVQVKTGGIVPLFGKDIMPKKEKVKSLALAENICSKFCEQYETRHLQKGLNVSRKVHRIAQNIYFRGDVQDGGPRDIYLSDSESTGVALRQQNYAHDTIYCDSAIRVEEGSFGQVGGLSEDKKYVHFMIPNKGPSRGSLVQEEPVEYLGIYAQVVDSRKIVIGKNGVTVGEN